MTSQSLWPLLAVLAEELAPVAQNALTAVADVSNAVVRADNRILQESHTLDITPSQKKNKASK